MIKMSQTVFLPFPQSFRWKELRVKVIFSWTDVMTSNSQRLLPCPWKMAFHRRAQGFNTHTEQNTAVQPVQPWLPQLERNYLTIVSLADFRDGTGQADVHFKEMFGRIFVWHVTRQKYLLRPKNYIDKMGGGNVICGCVWTCFRIIRCQLDWIRLTCDSGKSDSRLDVKANTFFT